MLETSLLEKTERLAQIGSWQWDIVCDAWTFSKGFRAIHGIHDDKPMRMAELMTLAYPEDRPAVEQAFNDAMKGQRPYDIEHRIVRQHDGIVRYVHAWGEVECNASGEPVALYGASQDITDRKQAELRDAWLAAVVTTSDDAIITHDLNHFITSWNAGAERLFGYSAAEAVGQHVSLGTPPELLDELNALTAKARRGESVLQFETKRHAKDGRILDVSATLSPIRDATSQVVGASAIVRDITDRKRMEEEIRRLAAIIENTDDAIISVDLTGMIFAPSSCAAYGIGLMQNTRRYRCTLSRSIWRL